ncbi:LOW QUALITY PROTEIN: hypothetical protein CVT26_015542 [Gymnopilus dilepis]|uniref:Uncharacterized protein n=1 Tax=Gymnopilus dilepis TaxID=231916 RepID=A0A409YD37_9AGAR|nr:LOW QUALITY PROTEIN: hypothetical protein CVT26_015542 [Gymnopilus dilepis]
MIVWRWKDSEESTNRMEKETEECREGVWRKSTEPEITAVPRRISGEAEDLEEDGDEDAAKRVRGDRGRRREEGGEKEKQVGTHRNVGAEPGTVWSEGVDQAASMTRRVRRLPLPPIATTLFHNASSFVGYAERSNPTSVMRRTIHASSTLDVSLIPLVSGLSPQIPSLPYVNFKIQTWWDIEEGYSSLEARWSHMHPSRLT